LISLCFEDPRKITLSLKACFAGPDNLSTLKIAKERGQRLKKNAINKKKQEETIHRAKLA
jgi:hypothetical protein